MIRVILQFLFFGLLSLLSIQSVLAQNFSNQPDVKDIFKKLEVSGSILSAESLSKKMFSKEKGFLSVEKKTSIETDPLALIAASHEFIEPDQQLSLDLIIRRKSKGFKAVYGRVLIPGTSGVFDPTTGKETFFIAKAGDFGGFENGFRGFQYSPGFYTKTFSQEDSLGDYIINTIITDETNSLVQEVSVVVHLVKTGKFGRSSLLRIDSIEPFPERGSSSLLIRGIFPINEPLFIYSGLVGAGKGGVLSSPTFSEDGKTLIISVFETPEQPMTYRLAIISGSLRQSVSKSNLITPLP